MKKYNIHILLSALFLSTTLSGCKKFLEHQPDNRTTLNTPEKVAELLVAAYPRASYITFIEAMSDNVEDKGTTEINLVNSRPWNYEDQLDIIEDTPNFYWNACYTAIAAANHALETIEKASNPAAYSASKGEALVARAYSHFMLVSLFSKTYNKATAESDPGIPYVTTPERTPEGTYERKTVAYVYDMIEKDLLAGLPLIKDNTYRIPKFHFTKVAANAFATRFYLFKKDYPNVVKFANDAFPTSGISTYLRPANTTYFAFGNNFYDIQALYTKSEDPGNLLLAEANSKWGDRYPGYRYGLGNTLNGQVLGSLNPVGAELYRVVFGAQPEFYNVPKFRAYEIKESISAVTGKPFMVIPLLSTEEVLFNRAEANVMLGQFPAAIADLNVYLSKRIASYNPIQHNFTLAKATTFYAGKSATDALIESILDYKRQEYIHEGLRWFDILRHNRPVTHTSFKGDKRVTYAANDPRRVLQIPRETGSVGLAPNPR
ncbi:RagB/SusD family nutrient uptake outer membrane protein [Pedobacter caeni]|uniref:SusD family protein n=1 Tax=Pedobacter caeni TaxID=288992 RepID=A0A1M5DIQ2_9SPHI|nr:RagB/SusD family nutrient uptake outer membrane protein [Pedobacter caeni]SHF66612.1 SusD family protein [Pedobacter caeni]